MNYKKRLLTLVAPCLIAIFSLAGFGAAAAQAEGEWFINGKTSLEALVSGEGDSASYSFLVPSLNIELVFSKFSMDESKLIPGGGGLKTLLFTEGKLYTISGGLKLIPQCEVGDLIFKVKDELFLHGGKTYLRLLPAEGTVLTETTYFGKECSLAGTKNPVTGAMILEDTGLEGESVTHLFKVVTSALFSGMLFGTRPMTLDGSFTQQLAGAHAGLKWSGIG